MPRAEGTPISATYVAKRLLAVVPVLGENPARFREDIRPVLDAIRAADSAASRTEGP